MVALAVALGVVRDAGVDAAVGARHLLQHEALVRDNHLLGDVVAQLATLQHASVRHGSFIPFHHCPTCPRERNGGISVEIASPLQFYRKCKHGEHVSAVSESVCVSGKAASVVNGVLSHLKFETSSLVFQPSGQKIESVIFACVRTHSHCASK